MKNKFFLWITGFVFMAFYATWQKNEIAIKIPSPDSASVFRKPESSKMKFRSFSYSYYDCLGAACKIEYKLEKASGVPFRFRLGSLEATDYMEQKPNAIKPSRMGH